MNVGAYRRGTYDAALPFSNSIRFYPLLRHLDMRRSDRGCPTWKSRNRLLDQHLFTILPWRSHLLTCPYKCLDRPAISSDLPGGRPYAPLDENRIVAGCWAGVRSKRLKNGLDIWAPCLLNAGISQKPTKPFRKKVEPIIPGRRPPIEAIVRACSPTRLARTISLPRREGFVMEERSPLQTACPNGKASR